jgi:hypothetical protein
MSTTWDTVHERALALSFRGGHEAIDAAHEALRLANKEEGEDSIAAFVCASTLAGAYLATGDLPRALRFQKQVVRIGERAQVARGAMAQALSILAYAHSALDEEFDAKQAAERALALLDGDAPQDGAAAKVLGNLAAVHGNLREHARATALCARAEAILEPMCQGSGDTALEARVDLARTCVNHAKNARQGKSFDEAEAMLQRALSHLEAQKASRLAPKAGDLDELTAEWKRVAQEPGRALDEATLSRIAALRA